MSSNYSLKLFKESFTFSAAHFLIFDDGSREALHGHNYRLRINGQLKNLDGDMVVDFFKIEPIILEICQNLDHITLIPSENPSLKISSNGNNIEMTTQNGSFFSFPEKDVKILPIANTTVENLSYFLCNSIQEKLNSDLNFDFDHLEVEVEEISGLAASYTRSKER